MRTIQAVSISSEVNRRCVSGFQGSVHSVFSRVMNVVVDEFLITLADYRSGEIPNGLLLDLDRDLHFNHLAIEPHMAVQADVNRLQISDADLKIDLSLAKVFPSERALPEPTFPLAEWASRLSEAIALGRAHGSTDGLCPLWNHIGNNIQSHAQSADAESAIMRAAKKPIAGLLASVQKKDFTLLEKSVSSLSGLGIGLTPSGDDILTGFVAAIVLTANALKIYPQYQPFIETILASSMGRTNLIAISYMRLAERHQVSKSLADYIAALVSVNGPTIPDATTRLFSYGGTSGCELAIGACLGLLIILVSQGKLDSLEISL